MPLVSTKAISAGSHIFPKVKGEGQYYVKGQMPHKQADPRNRAGAPGVGQVHEKGSSGYHGPRAASDPIVNSRRWTETAHQANRKDAGATDGGRRGTSDYDHGKKLLKFGAATAAVPMTLLPIGLELQRRALNRKPQTKKVTKIWDPSKVFHASDPGIRHAANIKGVHDISSIAKPRPKIRSGIEWIGRHGDGQLAADVGITAGFTGLTLGMIPGNKKITNKARADRARSRQNRINRAAPVAKKLYLKQHFGNPKLAVRTIGRNPQHIAAGGILAAATGVQNSHFDRKRTDKKRRVADDITAGVVGGTAGQLGWMGGTQAVRSSGHKVENKVPEGMTRGQRDKILRTHRKEYGVPHGGKPNRKQAPGFFQNYPESIPGAKQKRWLGHNATGRKGMALQAASVTTGVMGGLAASRIGRKDPVGKLYTRDQKTSLPHLLGAGAGAALGAWGLGRSGMLGRALGIGIKSASRSGNHNAFTALQMAQAAQGVLRRGTAPGERAMRQIRSVDRAINRVPSAMRPEIAMAAGTLLVGNNARHIRRDTYHPVNIRIRTGGGY